MAGQVAAAKTSGDGARPDDVGDRSRGERRFANLGEGRGGVLGGLSKVPAVGRHFASGSLLAGSQMRRKHRAVGDAGCGEPGGQRAHRTQFGLAVGQRDDDGFGLRALGLRNRQPQATVGLLQPLDADGRQLRAAQRTGKADQELGAVALAAQIVGDGGQQLA